MCNKYTLVTDPRTGNAIWGDELSDIKLALDLRELAPYAAPPELFAPRYNISPTQDVLVWTGAWERMRWGLVPPWAKSVKDGPLNTNARAETVFELPTFRSAARTKRCLVPADGFVEWLTLEDGQKQPQYFQMASGKVFYFAGLWESWHGPAGELHSCSLITTEANATVATVHHRMPVILPARLHAMWLDPEVQDPAELMPLLAPYPAERMSVRPVSMRISGHKHDDPSVLEPPAEATALDTTGQLRLF